MLWSLLSLGFFMGVRHALEADHLAAVASMATRASSTRDSIKLAAVWGTGHAAVLMLVGTIVAGLGTALPPGLSRGFEVAAGVILAFLGLDVLRRAWTKRVHFHVHRHEGGVRHVHAHSHAREAPEGHDPSRHEHEHPRRLLGRALVVGSVHGMAGSAALLVITLQGVSSTGRALAYVGVFGLGSILGMVLFSLAIALPLRLQARHRRWASHGFEAALGAASVLMGAWIAVQAGRGR